MLSGELQLHAWSICVFTINARMCGYLLCVKRDTEPRSDRSALFESFLQHEGRKVHAWEGSSGGRLIEYTEYTQRGRAACRVPRNLQSQGTVVLWRHKCSRLECPPYKKKSGFSKTTMYSGYKIYKNSD